ncbi:uncharacterized protein LOC135388292 [Ornithodoros turicata]|uniref:uncharacterized protein LOC135388292 n=1 Tax=Ornithodoros turicata TaxID=34597 RepID=UPI00313987E7
MGASISACDETEVLPELSAQQSVLHALEQPTRSRGSAHFSSDRGEDERSLRFEHIESATGAQIIDGSCTSLVPERSGRRPSHTAVRVSPKKSACGSEFEKKILRTINIMSLRQLEHSNQLDLIVSWLKTSNGTQEDEMVFPGPFTDMESFLQFDEEVQKSDAKKRQLQKYMMKLGGTNCGDRARRVLYALLSDEVAQQFNWTGIGGKKKFCSLECCSIMCSAINKMSDTGTIADTEKAVQTWLRHARERMIKKAAKKNVVP